MTEKLSKMNFQCFTELFINVHFSFYNDKLFGCVEIQVIYKIDKFAKSTTY